MRFAAPVTVRAYASAQASRFTNMKTQENFQPEPESARPSESFVPAKFTFSSNDYKTTQRQMEEQTKASAVNNVAVAHMLNGFSIDSGSEAKHTNMVCETGYASYYHPTGNATADGSAYTANNRLKAAAVDNKHPMGEGHVWLGSKLHVKNLDNGSQAIDVTVRDTGGFGRLSTPEPGMPRLIDLTDAAFEALQGNKSKGLMPVEVCYQSEEIRHKSHSKAHHHK